MNAEFWSAVRDLIARGQPDEALATISASWKASMRLDPEAVDSIAAASAKKGDIRAAISILNDLVSAGAANFHTFYRLAEYHRSVGDIEHTLRYFRLAHAQFGWHESLAHGYHFTYDYFSPGIPKWQSWFREHVVASPIEAIEVGSWQGGSATWLLDKVISCRGGSLTCVDSFAGSSEHVGIMDELGGTLEEVFDENVARTGHGDLLQKITGLSHLVLPTLLGNRFDFIYIDGAHEAKFVIQDALCTWHLLRPGGFMLFNGLNFTFSDHPNQSTMRAVDFFLSVFDDDLVVIDHHQEQLLIKRVS